MTGLLRLIRNLTVIKFNGLNHLVRGSNMDITQTILVFDVVALLAIIGSITVYMYRHKSH